MRIRDHFTQAELRSLLRRSNGLGWWAILVNWVMVFGALALVAVWPTPVSVVLALIVLGGRQLGFGALMHECGHGSLFASRALNQWAGKWLCAAPVAYRLDDYMNRHLAHHQAIGSAADPDLSRYRNYPVSPASFRRKLWRDLSGRTSLQFLRELIRTNGTVAGSPGRVQLSGSCDPTACATHRQYRTVCTAQLGGLLVALLTVDCRVFQYLHGVFTHS